MSGIYIHIPFCRSKCFYCDFYSVANNSLFDQFLNALIIEIENKKNIFNGKSIKTVYLGGGTPSLLKIEHINKIINSLFKHYKLSELKEFTFEANPEDLNLNYLKELRNTPINRISIGIQSVYSDMLTKLGRKHDKNIGINSIINSEKAGFKNICIDLIYGISGMSNIMWTESLNSIFHLPIKHLSAYHLSVEPNTLLYKKQKQKKYLSIDEKTSWEQFNTLIEISEKNGFAQYEISNFSLPEYKSIHNSSYWQDVEYIGCGPSAHSYFSKTRQWNINNIKTYIDNIQKRLDYYEKERINNTNKYNEYLIKRLRTVEGIKFNETEQIFGKILTNQLKTKIKIINKAYYTLTNEKFSLNPKGMFISNSIIEKLMLI